MAGGHNVRPTSWAVVALIVFGTVLLGFALPMKSVVLMVIGGVLLLAGAILGGIVRIMDDAY